MIQDHSARTLITFHFGKLFKCTTRSSRSMFEKTAVPMSYCSEKAKEADEVTLKKILETYLVLLFLSHTCPQYDDESFCISHAAERPVPNELFMSPRLCLPEIGKHPGRLCPAVLSHRTSLLEPRHGDCASYGYCTPSSMEGCL
jgi:hypothetical protein